jgi:hypothetical protein
MAEQPKSQVIFFCQHRVKIIVSNLNMCYLRVSKQHLNRALGLPVEYYLEESL